MVQSIDWLILIELLYSGVLFFVVSLLHFFPEGFELPELDQEWRMGQVLDVLDIVVSLVGCAPLVHLLEALGLMRVDALQNA